MATNLAKSLSAAHCAACATCPQCGQEYRCRANGVSVAVYAYDREPRYCIGIYEADLFGCSCGTFVTGFGRRPYIGMNDPGLAAQLASGLLEHEWIACQECNRAPAAPADGEYCSRSCRDAADEDYERAKHHCEGESCCSEGDTANPIPRGLPR